MPPGNPFFVDSELPYQLPPFADIRIEHFAEAFERGMADSLAEVAAIAGSAEPPSFENTIVALERSGRTLGRASRVFYLLTSADTNPELQALDLEYAPKFAAYDNAIMLDQRLFARIDAVYAARDTLDLTAEERRLVERYHADFVRAGAALAAEGQARLAEINTELASLATRFGVNLLADTNDSAVHLTDPGELDGLPPDVVAAAAAAAAERGLDGYLITLILPTHQPALELLTNRDVRRRVWQASVARGTRGNEHDTRAIVADLVRLRAERAALLGYTSHSDYVLADRMAQTNDAVDAMLRQLIPPAVANVAAEQAELTELMLAETGEGDLQPWDWAFYAARLKRERFDLDLAALKPYFELTRTLEEGVFHAAGQLYGISFSRRADLTAYHPDAVVYEVLDADGSPLGLFIGDYFTRDAKRGGAWMEAVVAQSSLLDRRPVVVNNMNIAKPPPGAPALMNFDEVGTMFHEFGHALHGLFSEVRYPRLAGTSVARDFVEFPSQVNEMWMTWPSVLERYARHHQTGDPLPAGMIDRITAGQAFHQGWTTVAYLAATWIDLCWHRLGADEAVEAAADLVGFEQRSLAAVGLDLPAVAPRYRSGYFNHIFGGSAYSAGYYSYIWSEMLDADTVDWFTSQGGPVRVAGEAFRRDLLSRGGTAPETDYVRAVLGRDARLEPLLLRRGLRPS